MIVGARPFGYFGYQDSRRLLLPPRSSSLSLSWCDDGGQAGRSRGRSYEYVLYIIMGSQWDDDA